MPPQCCSNLARSIFAEWGLNLSEYSSRGVPSKKTIGRRACLSRNDDSCPSLGSYHEGSHQKGGLGGACADGGGDGNARHRRRHLLLAVKPPLASECVRKQSRIHPFRVTLDCFRLPPSLVELRRTKSLLAD